MLCMFMAFSMLSETLLMEGLQEEQRNAGCVAVASACHAPRHGKQKGISVLHLSSHCPPSFATWVPRRSRPACSCSPKKIQEAP